MRKMTTHHEEKYCNFIFSKTKIVDRENNFIRTNSNSINLRTDSVNLSAVYMLLASILSNNTTTNATTPSSVLEKSVNCITTIQFVSRHVLTKQV